MVAAMFSPSMNSHPFDSIAFHAHGLTLSSCSCAGTSKHYIPRAHIDYVSSGRELYVKTLFVGLVLLAYGIYVQVSAYPTTASAACMYIGIALVGIAALAMLPQTLCIGSNNSTFRSTNCSNLFDTEAVLEWLRAGAPPEQNSPMSHASLTQLQTPSPGMASRGSYAAPSAEQASPMVSPPSVNSWNSFNAGGGAGVGRVMLRPVRQASQLNSAAMMQARVPEEAGAEMVQAQQQQQQQAPIPGDASQQYHYQQ